VLCGVWKSGNPEAPHLGHRLSHVNIHYGSELRRAIICRLFVVVETAA